MIGVFPALAGVLVKSPKSSTQLSLVARTIATHSRAIEGSAKRCWRT